jgi:hypothetical protein
MRKRCADEGGGTQTAGLTMGSTVIKQSGGIGFLIMGLGGRMGVHGERKVSRHCCGTYGWRIEANMA